MPHQAPLISTIVIALALAWAFAAVANRLKLPPIVGYLLAGIAIGPFTPGFVADQNIASELAEIGVILLMFGVGLHLSLALLPRSPARLCSAWGLVCGSAGPSRARWYSGSRCRWRAPSFFCEHFRNVAWLRPSAGASPWVG